MMCALIENNLAGTTDGIHEIFATDTFSVDIFQEQLAVFILENHDWNNESNIFKAQAENVFGEDWQQEVSEAASWIGLESTSEYANYINGFNDPNKQSYVLDIKFKVFNALNDCD